MTENQFLLSGVIIKTPVFSQSPAGIPHCSFSLEHQSQQNEAELNRNCYVRLQVVASGEKLQAQTTFLQMGDAVRVSGFLNRHQTRNGAAKLVLHAHQIERI